MAGLLPASSPFITRMNECPVDAGRCTVRDMDAPGPRKTPAEAGVVWE